MAKKKLKQTSTPVDKSKEYLDQLKRVQADFENHVKRVAQQQQQLIQQVQQHLLADLLHIIDDFHHALHHAKKATKEELIEGLTAIAKRLDKFLSAHNVRCMTCTGKPDPFKHEVIMEVPSTEEKGKIVDVIQDGYMMGDTVLRYAKVTVSKGGKNEQDNRN